MMTDQVVELIELDEFKDRDAIVLFGIEAHVCVQQTCLDLLEMGKEVHVIVDGVSSQQPFDREISLQRMANAGAFLTTAQSLVFMLMQSKFVCVILIVIVVRETIYFFFVSLISCLSLPLRVGADHPNFKAVSKLTVEHMKLPNEFNEACKK